MDRQVSFATLDYAGKKKRTTMRAFCNLELGRDPISDETTILNFRHLLEAHGLTKTCPKQWQSISKRVARCCAVARSSMRH